MSERPCRRGLALAERLLAHTTAPSTEGCWLWQGSRNPRGYGRITVNDVCRYAHRIAYEVFIGPIPAGLTVDHLCFQPSCINPSHLRLLTASENASNQRKARLPHCLKGHEYTPENTRWTGTKRRCKTCGREARRLLDLARATS